MVNDYASTNITAKLPELPKVAIILGSGLGKFTSKLKDSITIPYKEIINYPLSSIPGHAGEWVFGYINEKPIICASGRFHYYEGFSFEQVAITVNTAHALGCKTLIITNAAGCLTKEWELGSIMLIRGFIDYSFINGPNPPLIINLDFTPHMLYNIKKIASQQNITLKEGNYVWTIGPTYETKAEINDMINLGGNAVGMSTLPEIIKAKELGLNVISFSCLTNYGSGLIEGILTHTEVLQGAQKGQKKLSRLIENII